MDPMSEHNQGFIIYATLSHYTIIQSHQNKAEPFFLPF
jgi:hypothetical protein